MKKIIVLAGSLVMVLVISNSCKKANNSNPTNNNTPVLLSKFIELDTTQSAPNDTLEIFECNYDNLNRLIRVRDIDFNNYSMEESALISLYYNGSDTLPYKQTEIDSDFTSPSSPSVDNDTDYLSYNSSARLTADSTRHTAVAIGPGVFVNNDSYTYSGSTVIKSTTNTLVSPVFDTVTQTVSNGDVIAQIRNYPSYIPDNYSYSLDTHPNPFHKNAFNCQAIYQIEVTTVGEQKNNYTEVNESNAGTVFYHVKNQYTYLSNGYPSTVINYDYKSGSGVFQYKGIYVYK